MTCFFCSHLLIDIGWEGTQHGQDQSVVTKHCQSFLVLLPYMRRKLSETKSNMDCVYVLYFDRICLIGKVDISFTPCTE